MTTADKTGDKLVQSIRKTKAGASATAPKPRAPAATRNKAPTSKAPASAAAKPRATRKTVSATTDPYQSGQRVWPD